MDVVDRIDALLREKGVSAARMCRELGFSSGLYSQWRKRSQNPSADKLQKIARYFGVTVDYLMGGEGQPQEEEVSAIRYALYRETAGLSDDTLDRILQFARFARMEEARRREQDASPEKELP